MNQILRVDLGKLTAIREPVPKKYQKIGGRSLIAKIMLNEVKPTCEPLGRHNKLIMATGLLAGTGLSSANRISMGGKSPLTGGVKESNSGGVSVDKLARLGIKAAIIEGAAKDWYILHIAKNEIQYLSAEKYLTMGTYALCETLLKKFPKAAITCIGQGGERLYLSAGICHTDGDGKPGRLSGRGGLGAVMGSKKLKAIVIEGKGNVSFAMEDKFKELRKTYNEIIKEAPSSEAYRKYGTAAMVQTVNELGGLPTKNFSRGRFEKADDISAEALVNRIENRGGEGRRSHACMPGCLIKCSNVYPDIEGKAIVSPIEYETLGLIGSNLGISNLDTIAKINYECNDIGVDTIEFGAAVGVAMEAGIAKFGDDDAVLGIIDEVKKGTVLGRVIANGAKITGKVFGVFNVPVVKGQAMAAYDPRAIKGMGTTYATSAMGADHTAGPTARAQTNHLDPKSNVELSLKMQKLITVLDCTGLCLFTVAAVATKLDIILSLINALYGWNLELEWFEKMGKETLKNELKFNELAGLNSTHHRLPESFTERELPDVKSVFDVSEDDIDEMLEYR